MSAFKQIVKTEFIRYFYSPLALVYLICFLLLNGLFAFYFGHFFERERADLLSMFAFQPWLYILFVSGIAMRSWAEEFRSKTILQIATLPVPLSYFVWGKFFATWIFCLFALILTFPFWITVNIMGNPDNAVIGAGYIASLMLSGCMLAIAQTMSALTKNQIIALVLAVLANLLFFMSGLDFVLDVFRGFLAPSLVDMIASFSFLTHFSTMSAGLLELRDIVFFGSLIILFNLTTLLIVSYRTAGTTRWLKTSKRSYYVVAFVGLLLGFCGINLIANVYLRQIKIDFTEEKMFSLTPDTDRIIGNLETPVIVRLYYSSILGERNPNVRLFFDKIRLLLQQYAVLANGKIELKLYNPLPFSDAEDRALAAGIQPLPIISNNSNAYFGLTISDEKGNQEVIPFFPLSRQSFAEQDLTEAFYKLGRKKPKLGLLTSLSMGENIIENVTTSKWEILNQLEKFYDVYKVSSEHDNLKYLDALMIVHPQNLGQKLQENIRDYSLSGGKVLAFFDVATEAQQIYAPVTSMFTASDYGILPKAWGIRFVDKGVVADLGNSSFIDATKDYASNPEFTQDAIQFYVRNDGFVRQSRIVANLKKMLVTSASIFVPEKDAKIKFEPLLVAGKNSQLMSAKVVYDRIVPAVILRNFKADNKAKVLSARIKGNDGKLDVIVVGDSDLLYDSYWTTHQQVLEKNYSIPVLDNANFVLNALDALLGNESLLALRGKNYYARPFEKLERQRIDVAKDTKIKEKEILDNLARAKIGMTEITAKKNFEGRGDFTPDELSIIAKIRKKIDKERQNLFTIRNESTQYFERLKNVLQLWNVYFIPLVLLIVLLLPTLRKKKIVYNIDEKFNFKLLKIIIICLLLFGAGLLAAWTQNKSKIFDYENKSVFANLATQINDVTTITLQNHDETLEFYVDDKGEWKLKGAEHYLVYQNRIRNLLSVLLSATYYEKKTEGMERLSNFDLQPIENKGSRAVQITLANGKNTILRVNVGKYDIDLGRGSRGAYIRFNDSFQVWLIQADFVDLKLQKDNWLYNTLWNLQFGRLMSVNNVANVDQLANLAKELLNVRFSGAKKDVGDAALEFALDINGENNSQVKIDFYKSGNTYFVKYIFAEVSASNLLKDFAGYANGIFYEISAKDMEKIKNAAQPFLKASK